MEFLTGEGDRVLWPVGGHMAIWDEVTAGIKDAMRARDKERTSALRNIRAAFLETAKKDGSDSLDDDAAVAVLRRQAKQRRESIEAYEAGGRSDLVPHEQAELAVIDAFLPKLADEAATRELVAAAIAATGASSPSDVGKVMGAVMRQNKGQVDGALTRRITAELLGA